MDRSSRYKRQHFHAGKSSPYHQRRFASRQSHNRVTFDDETRKRTPHDYRGSISRNDTLLDIEEDPEHDICQDSDSDDSIFHWDEEATLLSALMDEGPQQNNDQHLDALADSLQGPFTDMGRRLKTEIAETVVPTHNHVKTIFKVLENNVDNFYGQGISLFNRACKDVEGAMYEQQAGLDEAFEMTRVKIEKLLAELEAEYAERDKLWTKFNGSLNEIVEPVLVMVKDTPARVERVIVELEKHGKAVEDIKSETRDMKSVKKGLQDLLRAA